MKNRIIITLVIFLILTASCNKTLELQPSESLPTEEALSDLPGLQTALHGVYNTLQSYEYYGNIFLTYPELLGNLVYLRSIASEPKPLPWVLLPFFYSYDMNAALAPTQVWNACYRTISLSNKIIENIDGVDGDEVQKDQIKGEALALRAMAHFDIVRFFARPYGYGDPAENPGVPIVLESVPYDYQPSRNTVKEVYEQVVKDLEEARNRLGNDVGKYRFSNDAATALLARVSLYKEDWDKAEELASELIESVNYPFVPADKVVAMFAAPGSSEEIFTLKFETSEDRGISDPLENNNLGANYIPGNDGGRGAIGVTEDLLNLYEPGDMRSDLIYWQDSTEYFQSKFQGQDGIIGLHSPKLLRIAEMYLIRAEARFQQGRTTDALEDLNALRLQRGATEWTALPTGTIKDILEERQRELAFEGHTSFDYWRTNTRMVRNQCDTTLFQNNGMPCEVLPEDPHTVQPIPRQEIDVNPNIKQNEGY